MRKIDTLLTIICISAVAFSCTNRQSQADAQGEEKQEFSLIKEVNQMLYMGILTQNEGQTTQQVENGMMKSMMELMKFYNQQGFSYAPISGAMILDTESRGKYVTFLPFSEAQTPPENSEGIKLGQTFGGEALKGMHTGSYSSVERTYKKMLEEVQRRGWIALGHSVELYLTDPQAEPDTSKWQTEITLAVETKPHAYLEVTDMPVFKYAGIRKEVTATNTMSVDMLLGQSMIQMNQKVMNACDKTRVHPPYVTGFNIINKRTTASADFEFGVGVPVSLNDESIFFQETKPTKTIRAVHHGAYDFRETYDKIQKYAIENGYTLDPKSIEIYKNDPRNQPDPKKNVTHIYVPIQ